jgi:hypothetical protein
MTRIIIEARLLHIVLHRNHIRLTRGNKNDMTVTDTIQDHTRADTDTEDHQCQTRKIVALPLPHEEHTVC